jgi:hypothetical protein
MDEGFLHDATPMCHVHYQETLESRVDLKQDEMRIGSTCSRNARSFPWILQPYATKAYDDTLSLPAESH